MQADALLPLPFSALVTNPQPCLTLSANAIALYESEHSKTQSVSMATLAQAMSSSPKGRCFISLTGTQCGFEIQATHHSFYKGMQGLLGLFTATSIIE
jgi:hypothetical protein